MKKVKLPKPSKDINWTSIEFSRRIVANLIRAEYIDETKAAVYVRRMLRFMQKNDLSLAQMRELSASVSRNASDQKRKKTAASLLSKLKRLA